MTELPPEAAALIEQARKAHGPKQADRDRILTGLHASLGIGAASALAAGSASATASAAESAALTHAAGTGKAVFGWKSALLTWKAGKVVLATVALGGAIGVGAVTRSPQTAHDLVAQGPRRAPVRAPARPAAFAERPAPEASAMAAPSLSAPEAPAQVAAVAGAKAAADGPDAKRTEPSSVADVAKAATQDEPATVRDEAERRSVRGSRRSSAARHSERRAVSKPASSAPSASSPVAAAVEAATTPAAIAPVPPKADSEQAALPAAAPKAESELVLIRRALTSLRDHDAEQALTVLAEHATRYPSGAFATERRGLRIVALCAAGLVDQGQREQAAFLQEAGSSPIAERVRRACSEDGR